MEFKQFYGKKIKHLGVLAMLKSCLKLVQKNKEQSLTLQIATKKVKECKILRKVKTFKIYLKLETIQIKYCFQILLTTSLS